MFGSWLVVRTDSLRQKNFLGYRNLLFLLLIILLAFVPTALADTYTVTDFTNSVFCNNCTIGGSIEASNVHVPLDSSMLYFGQFTVDANDSSGNGFDGVPYVTTHSFERYLFSNTTAGRIEIPASVDSVNGEFNLTDNITIAAWFKINMSQLSTPVFIAKGTSYTLRELAKGVGAVNGSFDMYSKISAVDEYSRSDPLRNDSLTDDLYDWFYLVGTFNNSKFQVFYNGIQNESANSGSLGSNLLDLSEKSVTIGALNDSSNPASGWIDEVVIYNRSLSGAEIFSNYQVGLFLNEPNTIYADSQVYPNNSCTSEGIVYAINSVSWDFYNMTADYNVTLQMRIGHNYFDAVSGGSADATWTAWSSVSSENQGVNFELKNDTCYQYRVIINNVDSFSTAGVGSVTIDSSSVVRNITLSLNDYGVNLNDSMWGVQISRDEGTASGIGMTNLLFQDKSMPFKIVRFPLRLDEIFPSEASVYDDALRDWTTTDSYVSTITSNNAQLLLYYDQLPSWIETAPANGFPINMTAYYDMINATATHYSQNASYWEVQNEPDSQTNFNSSLVDFLDTMSNFSSAIKSVNASFSVVCPDTAADFMEIQTNLTWSGSSIGRLDLWNAINTTYTTQCDILSTHQYTAMDTSDLDYYYDSLLDWFITNYGQNKEVWMTEVGQWYAIKYNTTFDSVREAAVYNAFMLRDNFTGLFYHHGFKNNGWLYNTLIDQTDNTTTNVSQFFQESLNHNLYGTKINVSGADYSTTGFIATAVNDSSGRTTLVITNMDIDTEVNLSFDWANYYYTKINSTDYISQPISTTDSLFILENESVYFISDQGNQNPFFEGVADFSLDEDFSPLTMDLTSNVSDVEDADSLLTYNWTLNDSSVFTLDIVNTSGIATFSSLPNAFGSVLVSISVVDTGGLSNSTEFTINVNPVNDVPTQTTPSIDSSDSGTNNTFADLIVSNQSTADVDGDIVYNSITWLLNNVTNISTIKPDDSGLVLFMPLDGNSTAEIPDYAGYDDNGTVIGNVTYNDSCQIDGCYEFAWDEGYIRADDSDNLDLGSFTLEAWIFLNQTDVFNRIISKGANSANDNYLMHVRSNAFVQLNFHNASSATAVSSTGGTALQAFQWYHVVGTWDNITKTMTIYVNGSVDVNQSKFEDDSPTINTNYLMIGAYPTTTFFNGSIDNVAIYNRSLSPEEVKAHFDSTKQAHTLPNEYTTPTDNWRAEVTPWDFTSSGTPLNTTELYINKYYNNNSGTIYIEECNVTLEDLNDAFNDPTIVEKATGNIFTLYQNINVNTTGCFLINATELRLNGTTTINSVGNLYAENTIIESWLNESGTPNFITSDRAYITSTGYNLIDQSTIAYLGTTAWSYYGFYPGTGSIIQNSNFTENYMGIFLNTNNLLIDNNSFYNNSKYSIFSDGHPDLANITNNYFNNSGDADIYLSLSANRPNQLVIENNTLEPAVSSSPLAVYSSGNITIKGNFITGTGVGDTQCIKLQGTDNAEITNNTCQKSQYGIYPRLNDEGRSINITDNYLFDNDIGITETEDLIGMTIIANNTFINSTMEYDNYNVPIVIHNVSEVYILDNDLQKIASAGILIQQATNISINNNSFDFIPIPERDNYFAADAYEPPCAISVVAEYKSWLGFGKENGRPDDITTTSQWGSDNISIGINSYDPDTQCYLRIQGSNVTYDNLPSFWYRSFQAPTYLFPRDEYFINPSVNNLTYFRKLVGTFNSLKKGYKGVYFIDSAIFDTWENYTNINDTQTYTVNIYNKSNALIYNTNLSVSPEFSDINSNDGDLTLTVGGLQAFYVLDDFNLTENIDRENSPLWFSASSSVSKSIASNLTDTINASVTITMPNCNPASVQRITYTSHTGTYTNTWTFASLAASCINNQLTLPEPVSIEPASASNTILIELAGSTSPGGGGVNWDEIAENQTKQQNITNASIPPANGGDDDGIGDSIQAFATDHRDLIIFAALILLLMLIAYGVRKQRRRR